MAKKVYKADLQELLNSSLKTALKVSNCANWTIYINSISATIKFLNESTALKFLDQRARIDGSPLEIFRECLENHTGKNLIPKTVKKENSIIIQVNYDIIE